MSTEPEVEIREPTPELESENTMDDMRTENAGSTPLPKESTTVSSEKEEPENEQNTEGDDTARERTDDDPAPMEAPPSTVNQQEGLGYAPMPSGTNQQQPQQQQLPLSINQMAIVASAQNKLPVSKVKNVVLRLSRHTESSGQKVSKWFKNDNYVDKDSYSWKNMSLFEDHQCHLWTPSGTVRNSYKK